MAKFAGAFDKKYQAVIQMYPRLNINAYGKIYAYSELE